MHYLTADLIVLLNTEPFMSKTECSAAYVCNTKNAQL